MPYVNVRAESGVAAVFLCRGKVNALDEATIEELKDRFRELEADEAVRAVVFSGMGKFFSFGFDIPGFLGYSNPEFVDIWYSEATWRNTQEIRIR